MRVKTRRARRPPGAPPQGGSAPQVVRGLDLTAAVLILLILAPLILVIAAALQLEGRGPLIRREERIGLKGRPFHVLRFDCDGLAKYATYGKTSAQRMAPSPIARHVRQARLDGVPQLWNVLRGEMSLVGPRPIHEADIAIYGPSLHTCCSVRPGVFHPAAAARARSMSASARIEFELLYASRKSLLGDLAVLAVAFPALLLQDGRQAEHLRG